MTIEYTSKSIIVDGVELTLEEINKNILTTRISNEDLVILQLEWPYCRGFDGITERKVYSKSQAEKVISTLNGVTVEFGEIAGKHSDIYGTLDYSDMSIIANESNVLDFLLSHPNGHDYDHSFIYSTLDRQAAYEDYDDESGPVPDLTYAELEQLLLGVKHD